jgi:type I restriction enzyme R subunit
MPKEARARIKINKLLEDAGWRFFDDQDGSANIVLENHIKMTQQDIDAFGNNFEKTKHGFIDFLLLDEQGFPLVVLEAKSEGKSPLDGKEQARGYAQSQHVRFIILSNGNLHYLWDIEQGNPETITALPRPEDFKDLTSFKPDPTRVAKEAVREDYVVLTQFPGYKTDPRWLDTNTRDDLIKDQGLKFLRPYQLQAISALQQAASEGKQRYLFEMATGTGKTLIAASVIKLFLKSGNAKRVLFLVDRLELEDQAYKNFVRYLKNDFTCVIYKENRDDWRQAEIVVSTIQTLATNNHFKKAFSCTDFDLLISDEAHRSIGGNSRAVFDYFVGYKLGLTATPKDYLKKVDPEKLSEKDPRELERRQLLDTYVTFGCASGTPTYRYSLSDGVQDGFLVQPTVADARTDITTKLLKEEGYVLTVEDEEGNTQEKSFYQRDFEKKFFSEETNRVFCKTFLENALLDPLSGEIGKSIVFCVSQSHASKITQIFNEFADLLFPGKYNSDFAVQITSNIADAQQMTINFANNNLNGHTNFVEGYLTSKTRVCVTVGMMTTGYDCEDILNVCLMRPVFSPTEFIQIKGRGTRKHWFVYKTKVAGVMEEVKSEKHTFKLFDFFANCEFFEEKYDYDQILKLPQRSNKSGRDYTPGTPTAPIQEASIITPDPLKTYTETQIGLAGMRIDRELFQQFGKVVKSDTFVQEKYDEGDLETLEEYVKAELLDQPDQPYTLETLRKAVKADRNISLREMIKNILDDMPEFKSKDDLLEEAFAQFVAMYQPDTSDIVGIKNFFKAYVTDAEIREIVEKKQFGRLATNAKLTLADFRALGKWRTIVPAYIEENVSLSAFE